MEPTSRSRRLSPEEKLRSGQKQVLQHFKQNWRSIGQLPTGYGKTLTGAACYKAAREAGKATCLLWIVPRAAQAEQARVSLYEDLTGFLGIKDLRIAPGEFGVIDAGSRTVMARNALRRNTCEVFVATIQSLLVPETREILMEMLSIGRWMLVADEYHHFGNADKSAWSQAVRDIDRRASCVLALSATPFRTDGASYFGKPDVVVTYAAAEREGAVKSLRLGAHEYVVDVLRPGADGKPEVLTFTTAELLDELGTDSDANRIDKMMAKKRMRFSAKYISPMVLRAVERLEDLRIRGIRSQMLVQAMSCFHAECLCTQIRALLPDDMSVDWVGTGPEGRDDALNRDIVERQFCPPKGADGKRPWSLDVLVNVGIASEGLDCVDVTEVVFCTAPTRNPTTMQTIGRAARTMRVASNQEQPVAHISVDTSSELRDYPGKRIQDLFDDPKAPPKPRGDANGTEGEGEGPGYRPLPEELYEGRIEVTWQSVIDDPAFLEKVAVVERQSPELLDATGSHDAFVDALVKAEITLRQVQAEKDSHNDAGQRHHEMRKQIEAAVRKVASLAMSVSGGQMRPSKERQNEVFRAINGRKKRHFGSVDKNTDFETLRHHYQWIRDLEIYILEKKRLPAWLS
jgi:superfamily II DNA or RNA helicase